jgi:simple sugar transport system permease protein
VTSFLYGGVFPIQAVPPSVGSPPDIPIPLLSQIPIVGPVLFDQDLLSYFAFLLLPIGYYVLYRTPLGVRLRAVGEDPRAADAAGIGVYRIRYSATIFGGVMAALGGFYLAVVASHSFYPEMTAGRGFIALAIVILGRWNPLGVLVGGLFFGSMLELQFVVGPLGIPLPYEVILMLPYLFTIVFLVAFSRGGSSPRSLARPYRRGA